MTLYEQAHLFNVLYNNDLIERPADHFSLAVKKIVLNEKDLLIHESDTIRRFHPFADWNNIRPSLLGMHNRLVENRADGLLPYDIPYTQDSATLAATFDSNFNEYAFYAQQPLSNYAKSGTTDDVLRPFNADVISLKRTNYAIWNATIRIELPTSSTAANPTTSTTIKDITIACIGECNTAYTGARDGKSQHKFLTTALLKNIGIPTSQPGFFAQYQSYLESVTPDSLKNCGVSAETQPSQPVARTERGD